MSAKKTKYTQICAMYNDLVPDGSMQRYNLMRILFIAISIQRKAQYQKSKGGSSVMIEGTGMETEEDLAGIEKECVPYVNFTAYFNDDGVYEEGRKLAELCKSKGYTIGVGTVYRQANRLGMIGEIGTWEWEI